MSNSCEATQGVVDKKKEEEGLDNKQEEERQWHWRGVVLETFISFQSMEGYLLVLHHQSSE